MDPRTQTRTVELTLRELTLIRVALLIRLDRLKGLEQAVDTFNDTRDLLMGKLSVERLHLHSKEGTPMATVYHFKTKCPSCGREDTCASQEPAPKISCGDCLMNKTEVVQLELTQTGKADQ